jgi:two-component system, OmpR family, alkaline phosphatase synthesis response regulator PhoP
MAQPISSASRILVVDDDESIRNLYQHLLAREGYEVHTALNGLEAIERAAAILPSLIILDLIMPEQEGIETLLQLHSTQPEIPVITISGAIGANEYLHVSSLLGAKFALQKPIKPEVLVKTVKSVLQEPLRSG